MVPERRDLSAGILFLIEELVESDRGSPQIVRERELYVRPVDRFTPAKKADTSGSVSGVIFMGGKRHTQDCVKGVVCQSSELVLESK